MGNGKENLFDLIERLKIGCVANELQIMEETGLSPAEYHGIAALTPGETVCGYDVSHRMNLSPSRASRVVDKMVRNGYLFREIDPVDRRKCTICLAPKGEEVKEKIEGLRNNCDKKMRAKLSDDEFEQVTGGLKKLISAM